MRYSGVENCAKSCKFLSLERVGKIGFRLSCLILRSFVLEISPFYWAFARLGRKIYSLGSLFIEIPFYSLYYENSSDSLISLQSYLKSDFTVTLEIRDDRFVSEISSRIWKRVDIASKMDVALSVSEFQFNSFFRPFFDARLFSETFYVFCIFVPDVSFVFKIGIEFDAG